MKLRLDSLSNNSVSMQKSMALFVLFFFCYKAQVSADVYPEFLNTFYSMSRDQGHRGSKKIVVHGQSYIIISNYKK